LITGTVRCVDRGAGANASYEAGGVVIWIWNTDQDFGAVPLASESRPDGLTTARGGENMKADCELEAGQFIRGIQNAGANAQFKINAKVKELPA